VRETFSPIVDAELLTGLDLAGSCSLHTACERSRYAKATRPPRSKGPAPCPPTFPGSCGLWSLTGQGPATDHPCVPLTLEMLNLTSGTTVADGVVT
jgi:hypothetical protein